MASEQDGERRQRVLVEMRVPRTRAGELRLGSAAAMGDTGFEIDPDYEPVPVGSNQVASTRGDEDIVVVRGAILPERIAELEARPDVVRVWRDTPIAPFAIAAHDERVMTLAASGPCPTDECDCSPAEARGDILDVARFLGVDRIWSAGFRGQGIIVGVVDGGITARGRTPRSGETAEVPRVIGGWPAANWGTTAAAWGRHGNMSATDALGMAPEAQLYDIRISDGDSISSALGGFQWAIEQHRRDGTPHILTNSWGIYQESWDPDYAANADHPFTRKVVEAIREGILVLFAAGNCGAACPSDRCGADNGPGRSIWGANGHPEVMTVGAANLEGQFVGYSSQGPAALGERKPDFCSITHFRGYFASDNGTSAACPIAAGVTALLKQAAPELTQQGARQALIDTAADAGTAGWDPHTGAGIIQAAAAWQLLSQAEPSPAAGEPQRTTSAGLLAPAAAVLDDGAIAVFATGADHALYRSTRSGDGWSEAERIGGVSVYPPAVVQSGGRTEMFTVGPSGGLYHSSGAETGAWRSLGGACTRGLAAVSPAPERFDLFTTGVNGALYHKTRAGNTWSRWRNLGGEWVSPPAAVAGSSRIDVFALGVDSAVWHRHWDGRRWSEAQSLGGTCLFGVAATSSGDTIDVFAVFIDYALQRKHWDGTTWSEWQRVGGTWTTAPAAVSANGAVYAFAGATDGGVYALTFDPP